MNVYRVRLHERSYTGLTDDGAGGWVVQYMVRASSAELACKKALAAARKAEYTACRVTLCIEDSTIGDVLP
jgi:hypothetical protein